MKLDSAFTTKEVVFARRPAETSGQQGDWEEGGGLEEEKRGRGRRGRLKCIKKRMRKLKYVERKWRR